ncbi:MAG: hypothetical protein ABFD91_00485 [Anaerohalosphaeraceae bacterium]
MVMSKVFSTAIVATVLLAGCSTYKVPGAGANMGKLMGNDSYESLLQADSTKTQIATPGKDIKTNYDLKPESRFPAYLIFLRLQDKGYHSYSVRYGNDTRGDFSVITIKDVEKDGDFDHFRSLAGVAQVGTLSSLLLPSEIRTEKDLRLAASRLQADILILYTVDTKFWSEDAAAPLSVITLGLSPSVTVNMVSTVSAVLIDVRTGYIYGMAEATDKQTQLSAWWTNESAVDQSRQRTERAAFEKMLTELEKLWIQLAMEKMTSK